MPDKPHPTFDPAKVLQNLASGILIFDANDQLVFENALAQEILGPNLQLIRSEGWAMLAMLVDAATTAGATPQVPNELRAKAQRQNEAVRFHMLIGGSYTPCWISSLTEAGNQRYTILTLERPDWGVLTELMSRFRSESQTAITGTSGHAKFIKQLLQSPPKKLSVEELGKRAVGMVDLIAVDMFNLQVLMDLLHRLETLRTGQLAQRIQDSNRRVHISDFIEDFVEELSEKPLLDPTMDVSSLRDRITMDIDDGLYVNIPKNMLEAILRDLLRNAILYSEPETPITIRARSASQGRHAEVSVQDQGYGVRDRETERVFRPFERARQPQIMREAGYGLSLYLAKAEIEALGGRMWFESEEGVGSTFSFKLPTHSK